MTSLQVKSLAGAKTMNVSAGLLIDFGNSGTRVALMLGDKTFVFSLSNRFAKLPSGYEVNTKYANEKSSIFKYGDDYYANGQLVVREFKTQEIRPSSLESKTTQLPTDLTITLAILRAYHIITNQHKVTADKLDVVFNISCLLPPLDHDKNQDAMEMKIRQFNKVTSLIPLQGEFSFTVGNVNVFSEAVSAFFGAFYHEADSKPPVLEGNMLVLDNSAEVRLKEVERNLKFSQGYVFVLDIGAGTTDVALFEDMELVENSKDTFNKGGNTVESSIRNDLRREYGFAPPSLAKVMQEGNLEEGGTVHDVTKIVTAAKTAYSNSLMEDIKQYFERSPVPVRMIKGLLVVGGGALPSVRNDQIVSPSMATVLMEYLQQLAPYIEVVNVDGKDLRSLNIEGLLYMHKYA